MLFEANIRAAMTATAVNTSAPIAGTRILLRRLVSSRSRQDMAPPVELRVLEPAANAYPER